MTAANNLVMFKPFGLVAPADRFYDEILSSITSSLRIEVRFRPVFQQDPQVKITKSVTVQVLTKFDLRTYPNPTPASYVVKGGVRHLAGKDEVDNENENESEKTEEGSNEYSYRSYLTVTTLVEDEDVLLEVSINEAGYVETLMSDNPSPIGLTVPIKKERAEKFLGALSKSFTNYARNMQFLIDADGQVQVENAVNDPIRLTAIETAKNSGSPIAVVSQDKIDDCRDKIEVSKSNIITRFNNYGTFSFDVPFEAYEASEPVRAIVSEALSASFGRSVTEAEGSQHLSQTVQETIAENICVFDMSAKAK